MSLAFVLERGHILRSHAIRLVDFPPSTFPPPPQALSQMCCPKCATPNVQFISICVELIKITESLMNINEIHAEVLFINIIGMNQLS